MCHAVANPSTTRRHGVIEVEVVVGTHDLPAQWAAPSDRHRQQKPSHPAMIRRISPLIGRQSSRFGSANRANRAFWHRPTAPDARRQRRH
jgi:hypothetical protein